MAKLVPLGDSLTAGNETSTGYRTWRGTLQNLLGNAGYTGVDFVGPESLQPASGGTDPNHAAWGGACIDSTGSASNNLTDRLAAIKTNVGTLGSSDLVVLFVGWNDVYNSPSNIATRYESLVTAVLSGAWSGTKLVMCTLPPQQGQTEAQTNGALSAYAALNAKIRSLANGTTRFVADLAALTGASGAQLLEAALSTAQRAPEFSVLQGGGDVPNWQGGHLVTSFKSIQDFNAQWSTSPPRSGSAPGGTGLIDYNADAVVNGVNTFVANVSCVVPWFWCWALQGNNSDANACIEVRNGFAQAKRKNGGWDFFFQGSRFGDSGTIWNRGGSSTSGKMQMGVRPDGITSYYKPDWNTGIEVWPKDTVPSRGIMEFLGGSNRSLMADAEVFLWGCQARIAKLNASGPDNLSTFKPGLAVGADFFTTLGHMHYDRYGFPRGAMDGGHDAWRAFNATEWTPVLSISIGRQRSSDTGVDSEHHWSDPGTPPPLANWSPPTPYNNPGNQSVTASYLRANPPRVPDYWEGSGGSGSGYSSSDYWDVIHLLQSGADKVAGVILRAITTNSLLSTGGGGGTTPPPVFSPMPGLATKPNVFTLLNGSSKKNVEPKNRDINVAPVWQTDSVPAATIGAAYSAQLAAGGEPTPTYTIVSGGPAWLACSSSGALSGTPTGSATTHTITFRATNSVGSADLTLLLSVVVAPVVTTTTLPAGVTGTANSQQLAASGTGPFTWSVASGALPAGLSLSAGGVIAGTPTSATTASFTVRATASNGGYDDQALSLTITGSNLAPVFVTTSLPAGTVGSAYSQTVSITGATSRSVTGTLPAGLSFNTSTGVLSGTPTSAETRTFTITGTNAYGSASQQFTLTVNAAPVTTSIAGGWSRWLGK